MTRDLRAVRHRSLHSRNGNALACAACGKVIVPKSGSRRQKYCQDACKIKACRSKKLGQTIREPDPYDQLKISKQYQHPAKADFGGRAFPTKDPLKPPRRLLSGRMLHRSIRSSSRKILRTEIGALARLFPQRPDRS